MVFTKLIPLSLLYRVFSFQEGDKGTKESANAKGLVKVFQKGADHNVLVQHVSLFSHMHMVITRSCDTIS